MDELINYLIAAIVAFPYMIILTQTKIQCKIRRNLLKQRKGLARFKTEGRQIVTKIINLDDKSCSFANKNFDIEGANKNDQQGEFWVYENGIPCLDFDVRDTRAIPHSQKVANVNELISPSDMEGLKQGETSILRAILIKAWSFLTQNKFVIPLIIGILVLAGIAAYYGFDTNQKINALIPTCQTQAELIRNTTITQAQTIKVV